MQNIILLFKINLIKNPVPKNLFAIILQIEGLTILILISIGLKSEFFIWTSFILSFNFLFLL